MEITVDSFYVLRNYLAQLFGKASQHTSDVSDIALSLIGGIIWRSTEEVQFKQYTGEPLSILWMTVAAKKYCFAYNYDTHEIELREEDTKGKVLATFTNKTSITAVKKTFRKL